MRFFCTRNGTKIPHQLVGYADNYLGTSGKYFMLISLVIGAYGAMLAYTLGISQSLAIMIGGPQWLWMIIFYIIMGMVLLGGLRALEASELYMEIGKVIIFIVLVIALFSSTHFSTARLTGFNWQHMLIPYGVLLFAYVGTAAIPEIRAEMRRHTRYMKQAIIAGSVIPMIFYAVFTFAAIGVSGNSTTEVATVGLAQIINGGLGFVLLHVFAVLAMSTSFIAMGYALKQSYETDFGMPHGRAWFLTMIIPVLLLGIGMQSFVKTLNFAGTFAGGTAGVTVVLMHAKATKMSGRTPEYTIKMNKLGYAVMISLFAVGMLYQLFLFL